MLEHSAIRLLTTGEQGDLNQILRSDPLAREVVSQLRRVLASAAFSRVGDTTKDFLSFVVLKTLIARAGEIKELTIAIRVFNESTTFEPLLNSKVRVAGFALRRRLVQYFEGEGINDPLEIRLPKGSYVPILRPRSAGSYAAAPNPSTCRCCGATRPLENHAPRIRSLRLRKRCKRDATRPKSRPPPLMSS